MGKKLTGYPSFDRPNEIGATFFEKHPFIPNLNIYTLLKLLNLFNKDKIAVSCNGLEATYGQLIDKDAVNISLALKELGVSRGEFVAISMPNYYQAVASIIACNRIGAVAVPLDNEAGLEETCESLNDFGCQILINYEKSLEINEKIKSLTKLRHVITLKKENLCTLNLNKSYHLTTSGCTIDFHSLNSIASERRIKFERPHFANETAVVLFTSGSTGKPKPIKLSNKNIIAAEIYAANTSHTKNIKIKKTLVCVPFRYPYGLITSLLSSLFWGVEAILAPDIGPATIRGLLMQNPDMIFGSPAVEELAMRFGGTGFTMPSLQYFVSGGDFLQLMKILQGIDYFKSLGATEIKILDGFGNGETSGIGSTPVGVKEKRGTSGKILVGTKYRLVDPAPFRDNKKVITRDDIKDVPYNTEGLLLVAGEHVFKEYFNRPELTEEAFITIDGVKYFNTGTSGEIDEEGYWKVSGRLSRFYIMSSLFKVYLDHVQTIIATLGCVKDCAVVAVPDNELLFTNKAYIVLKDGYEPSPELLNQLYESFSRPTFDANGEMMQLKNYEIPKYVEFTNELPRIHGSEKIDYSGLTEDARLKHVL